MRGVLFLAASLAAFGGDGNGILAGQPKVYDERSLRTMLDAARRRLGSLPSQTASGKPGQITGATQTQAAIAGSPSTPSPAEILNEQMQLNFEIANLQALLDGPMSDRVGKDKRYVKPRVTIGFPVSILPPPEKRYRNAVAVVEVTASTPAVHVGSEPPAVAVLLPRDRSYNAATITDNVRSVGTGVVTQVANFGPTAAFGRKTFYVVQDQDTIALMLPSQSSLQTSFAWHFRPVLGQEVVSAGLRQVFAQLAFPVDRAQGCYGQLAVRTYWMEYDRKRGAAGRPFPETAEEKITTYDVTNLDLAPIIESSRYEDLGGGQLMVHINGQFLNGTFVRVGSRELNDATPGFKADPNSIRFPAKAAEIGRRAVYVVGRDGQELEVKESRSYSRVAPNPSCVSAPTPVEDVAPQRLAQQVEISAVSVQAYDERSSRVTVDLSQEPVERDVRDTVVVVIGEQVFGLRDAPIQRGDHSLSFVAPTNLLRGARELTARVLLRSEKYSSTFALTLPHPASPDRLVTLSSNDGITRFALYGSLLKNAKVLQPSGLSIEAYDNGMGVISIPTRQVPSVKNLLISKGKGRPVVVPVPPIGVAELVAPPKPPAQETPPARIESKTEPPVKTENVTVEARPRKTAPPKPQVRAATPPKPPVKQSVVAPKKSSPAPPPKVVVAKKTPPAAPPPPPPAKSEPQRKLLTRREPAKEEPNGIPFPGFR